MSRQPKRRRYPKPLQWRVDYDYLDKLSPGERKWLEDFTDAYVGGDFRHVPPEEWSPAARSEVNAAKNASKHDVMALATSGGALGETVELPLGLESMAAHLATSPAYLETEEYRQARDKFRKRLHPHKRDWGPLDSLAFRAAQKRLERVTKDGDGEDDGETEKW